MFRNSLLILLIFLLPIRSWASESMGLKMAQSTHSVEMMAKVAVYEMSSHVFKRAL